MLFELLLTLLHDRLERRLDVRRRRVLDLADEHVLGDWRRDVDLLHDLAHALDVELGVGDENLPRALVDLERPLLALETLKRLLGLVQGDILEGQQD